MKQIVVFPRGQLTPADRKSLARAGCVVIEADDPTKVVTVIPGPPFPADEAIAIAMEALAGNGFMADARERFVKHWAAVMRERVEASKR